MPTINITVQENNMAGNPVIVFMKPGTNMSSRYRVCKHDGSDVDNPYTIVIYDGIIYTTEVWSQVDLSVLFASQRNVAGVERYAVFMVDDSGIGGPTPLGMLVVYGGGISKALQRKLTALNTDIFQWKLKAVNKNFFLTTRTNGVIISVPEDEIMPLEFYARYMKFSVTANVGGTVVTVATVDRTADMVETVQSIDFAALRVALAVSDNVLVNVFDIMTETSYSCSYMILESDQRTEYFLKFRNSWGSWEKIALQGDISFTPVFTEVTQVAEWDEIVNDFVTKNQRKEVTNSFPAGVGYRSEAERLFVIDMMMSDTVILIAHGLEYMVNVSGELPTLVSTDGQPVTITLKIDMVDKETNFSDLVIESEYETLATMTLEDINSGNADIIV